MGMDLPDLDLGNAVNDAILASLSPWHRSLVTRGLMSLDEAYEDAAAWRERQAAEVARRMADHAMGPPHAHFTIEVDHGDG